MAERLKALERENRELRQANEILRRASPEIIRLAVMMYVRFPLSLRNVEDLLHERGIDISHKTVRFRRMRSLRKFASVHASVFNHFNRDRSLSSRDISKTDHAAALAEWRDLCAV